MKKSFHCALTNFFRVKDAPGFKAWAAQRGLAVLPHPGKRTRFALAPGGGRQQFQRDTYHGDTGRDLADELRPFVAKGEVALFLELGTRGKGELSGYIIVVTGDTARSDTSLEHMGWTCLEASLQVHWRNAMAGSA